MNNRVAIFKGPHQIEILHTELLNPKKNEVCVEFKFCSICGGDYSTYIGRRTNYPYSLGHEFVGEIICIGEEVVNFKKGDFVVSDYNYRCGKCRFCMENKSHLCDLNDIGLFSNRAFSMFANINENYLYVIPFSSYLPKACLIEPLSCVLHACQTMRLKSNHTVLICGGGGIGSLFCFYLTRILKNPNVYINEINNNKLLKITKLFDVKPFDQSTDINYDWIIDCSNTITGVKFSLDVCEKGGHICIMSHLYGLDTAFIYDAICSKELSVLFPLRNGEKNNMVKAIKYIERYWCESDDELLEIFDNIFDAFKEKENSNYCKQIINLSKFPII